MHQGVNSVSTIMNKRTFIIIMPCMPSLCRPRATATRTLSAWKQQMFSLTPSRSDNLPPTNRASIRERQRASACAVSLAHCLLHSPLSAQTTNSMKNAILVCTVQRCNLAIVPRLGHMDMAERVQQVILVLGRAIYTASHERWLPACSRAEIKMCRATRMGHVCRVAW